MSTEIMGKLNKIEDKLVGHDKRFDRIDKRLDAHDKRFDKIDKRLDAHDKRFDRIEGQVELVAMKIVEHDDRFDWFKENMATKDDFRTIAVTLDKLVDMNEKNGQEILMLHHGLGRVEEKVDKNTADIACIKPLVGLA